MIFAEDSLQASVVATLRLSPGLVVLSIPNGGRRNRKEAARMKTTGTLAGASDLLIIWPGRVCFCELKAPGRIKRTSEAQDIFIDRMKAFGHLALVADSVEAVEGFLRANGAPIRTKVAA